MDVVHALPLLEYLEYLPQDAPCVETDWVVEEGNREVLEGHPLIRKVHLVRTRAWRRSGLPPVSGVTCGYCPAFP